MHGGCVGEKGHSLQYLVPVITSSENAYASRIYYVICRFDNLEEVPLGRTPTTSDYT